jgi:hypothetical protein
MGETEIDNVRHVITVFSHIMTYGNEATEDLTERIRDEIETMWNEPTGYIYLGREQYKVIFSITAELKKDIQEMDILQNTDPRNNFFRIEKFATGSISFVDGLGCNSGYFLVENLYEGSTTAAHEYGHTLGLDHPQILDIRGEGVPGIMYPRGTLVDPQYQYDPAVPPGLKGGTMHPMFRKVRQTEIEQLRLQRLRFRDNKAIIGQFTNIYHPNHDELRFRV